MDWMTDAFEWCWTQIIDLLMAAAIGGVLIAVIGGSFFATIEAWYTVSIFVFMWIKFTK